MTVQAGPLAAAVDKSMLALSIWHYMALSSSWHTPESACGGPAAFSEQSAPQPGPVSPLLLPFLPGACNTRPIFSVC